MENLIDNILFDVNQENFPLKVRKRGGKTSILTTIQHCIGVSSQCNQEIKRNERYSVKDKSQKD